jgi:hypothetical protein
MCHATTRGGRNLVPAIFYSLSWHPNLLLQHHTIWKCLRLRGVAKSFAKMRTRQVGLVGEFVSQAVRDRNVKLQAVLPQIRVALP